MDSIRILVIEDDEAARKALCAVLRKGGFEPVEAANGRAGFDAFDRERPALVITDLIMPEFDGIEAIQRIRDLDPEVPILAISGSGTERFSPLDDARMIGADRVMGKPYNVEEMLGTVRDLLEGRA